MVPVSPIGANPHDSNNERKEKTQREKNQIYLTLIANWRHGECDEEQKGQNGPCYWRHFVLSRQNRTPLLWLNQSLFQDLTFAVRTLRWLFQNIIRHAGICARYTVEKLSKETSSPSVYVKAATERPHGLTARRRIFTEKVSTCVLALRTRSVKKPHLYVNLARASSLCGELGHHIAEDCDWLPGMHTGLSLSVSREFHSLGPRRGHAP